MKSLLTSMPILSLRITWIKKLNKLFINLTKDKSRIHLLHGINYQAFYDITEKNFDPLFNFLRSLV